MTKNAIQSHVERGWEQWAEPQKRPFLARRMWAAATTTTPSAHHAHLRDAWPGAQADVGSVKSYVRKVLDCRVEPFPVAAGGPFPCAPGWRWGDADGEGVADGGGVGDASGFGASGGASGGPAAEAALGPSGEGGAGGAGGGAGLPDGHPPHRVQVTRFDLQRTTACVGSAIHAPASSRHVECTRSLILITP
jgi:hypothetical protein